MVAERGERVLPKGSSGDVTVVHQHTWQVQALDARSFDAYLRTQGKASIARVVQEANAESLAFAQGLRR